MTARLQDAFECVNVGKRIDDAISNANLLNHVADSAPFREMIKKMSDTATQAAAAKTNELLSRFTASTRARQQPSRFDVAGD